jgi:prepilin-type N-terminal cleavage/methylation domain-containing protein
MKSKHSKFKIQNSTFNNQGYTLVEILVAITIFAILIAGPTGLFVSSLRSQTRSLALRETIDNTSYMVEYISRALRMARKDLVGDCINPGANYEITYSGHGIRFKNYKGECQEFYLDGGQLKENKDGNVLPLTSDNLEISIAKFQGFGQYQGDNFQPRITMLFEIAKKGVLDFPETRIQTTISQRNLDITY